MTTILARIRRRDGGGRDADRFDRRLIAPMLLGSILNPVNSSIIAVSLVPIGVAFGAPPAQTAWLVSALYLATSIGQPVVGRLIDLYGPRRLYLAGATLVGVAGALGTAAPDLGVLVAARVLLGFGTCAGYPAAMYLIRSEATRTGRDSPAAVLTALAVASQTIAVIGPTLGGLLIGVGGWRATFALNIPLAGASLLLGALRLPRTPPRARSADQRLTRLVDLAGMALFAAALVALLLFLMSPAVRHLYLAAIAVAAAAGFAVRELRARTPFIDLRVLGGNAPLLASYARALLAMTVGYAVLYGFTQWLEDGRGLTATGAGLVLLFLSLSSLAVSAVTGRRAEIRGKLVVGALTQLAAGLLLLFAATAGSPIWLLLAIAVVAGVPQGLNNLANQNAVYHQADPAQIGASAGLLRTFSYLGAIVASAANAGFLAHGADTAGLHHLAAFLVCVAALFLLVTLADRSLRRITGRPGSA
ncbi:MFS transporter [Actinocatenispora thailandica]|uniref:MFS transporter n=1 Tax=Actinocatenispora thailandica TaxID=227318 RepID=A0A7R7DNT2_9ACTN|nr:MFS transporter [Actinocatenispora thailandica]BCJ35130.1 MFS transporter [Actinocatenispora thailandica]